MSLAAGMGQEGSTVWLDLTHHRLRQCTSSSKAGVPIVSFPFCGKRGDSGGSHLGEERVVGGQGVP